ETEFFGSLCVEAPWPAGDDIGHGLVRLATDQARGAIAGHPAQRLDLVADRCRKPGHGDGTARAEPRGIELCCMDDELHGSPWACKPVPDTLAYRKDCFLADQRFAQNAGKEAGGCFVRLARA